MPKSSLIKFYFKSQAELRNVRDAKVLEKSSKVAVRKYKVLG